MSKDILYSLLFGLAGVILAPLFLLACLITLISYALFLEIRLTGNDLPFSAGGSNRPSEAAT